MTNPAPTLREWRFSHFTTSRGDGRRDAGQDYLESASESIGALSMAQCSCDGTAFAGLALTVEIAPHRRNRPRCASCGQASAVYDRLALRRFEFVPL